MPHCSNVQQIAESALTLILAQYIRLLSLTREEQHVKADRRGLCYIHAIGTAVPEYSLGPEGTVELFRQATSNPRTSRLLQSLVRLSGVERRHLAVLEYQQSNQEGDSFFRKVAVQPAGPGMSERTLLFGKIAGPLVLRALHRFTPAELASINLLVTASCTHASAPGLEGPILAHTPVPRTVDRWNLGFMGCSAGLAALRLVHQTARDGMQALIVACELSSLQFQYTDRLDQLTANVLFADGAAAVAVSSAPSHVRVLDCRCVGLPEAADQMTWQAADHGLEIALARELPDTIGTVLPGVVGDFLKHNNLSPTQVNHWLVHPGGPQILDSVEKCLSLSPDALALSRNVLRNYGNMSSPTIFFILNKLLAKTPRGNIVALAFGPGLTIEMVLLHAH
jgi:alkylresorcinol/alkylpyrone synthase